MPKKVREPKNPFHPGEILLEECLQPMDTRLPVPRLGVDTWFNLPAGKSRVELADYAGQCIYLYCFQSWCPGCHSHGFPTMLRMMELFADEPKLSFLTVQTVFEFRFCLRSGDSSHCAGVVTAPIFARTIRG